MSPRWTSYVVPKPQMFTTVMYSRSFELFALSFDGKIVMYCILLWWTFRRQKSAVNRFVSGRRSDTSQNRLNNMSFGRREFTGNRLHWYWQPTHSDHEIKSRGTHTINLNDGHHLHHLHYHRLHHLLLAQNFILNSRLGSSANPFLHRPFPFLPDWLHGLSDHAQRLYG